MGRSMAMTGNQDPVQDRQVCSGDARGGRFHGPPTPGSRSTGRWGSAAYASVKITDSRLACGVGLYDLHGLRLKTRRSKCLKTLEGELRKDRGRAGGAGQASWRCLFEGRA